MLLLCETKGIRLKKPLRLAVHTLLHLFFYLCVRLLESGEAASGTYSSESFFNCSIDHFCFAINIPCYAIRLIHLRLLSVPAPWIGMPDIP